MKPGSIMLLICIFVIGLVFAISQPSERKFMRMVSSEIVQIIKENINALRDKIRGVEPRIESFYVEAGEDDWDPEGSEIGVEGIFESDDSVDVGVEWEGK